MTVPGTVMFSDGLVVCSHRSWAGCRILRRGEGGVVSGGYL